MEMHRLLGQIDEIIRSLAEEYRQAPGMILTEDDLKCLLVHRLLRVPELRRNRRTVDKVLGSMVHTEVSWFDENHQLCIKPDITILDPGQLSIFRALRHGYPLPNKGFNFDGGAIIFELKFVRNRQGVTESCLRAVQRDLDKIMRLLKRIKDEDGGDNLFCYFVVFSKVGRRVPKFDELVNRGVAHPSCRLVFHTAGVVWPRHNPHGA